ncbi:biopolymer transporter ExbD [Tateyamaria omphalii]|uniref:ExbD/TolR family protein n=1 Tax=Tateyamaria omphalii TaxID=299262 RepID=UPI001C99D4FF|nr:biopolymer transporter ExbD [Tateyamaria omphalii]MBY5935648.1 biopolymer transporter ExbD [Tateyamaria omphalii]
MTSLIDVIFLLLLFFMLTSTFSTFAEVELTAGGVGQGAAPADVPPLFLRVAEDAVALNGSNVPLDALAEAMSGDAEQPVIVSLQDGVTAQRLTDLLVVLRAVPGLQITVLGQG